MAQVVRSWTAIVATTRKPAANGRQRTGTDGGDKFVSNLLFGIELFRRHSQFAVAVEFNQVSLSLSQRMGISHSILDFRFWIGGSGFEVKSKKTLFTFWVANLLPRRCRQHSTMNWVNLVRARLGISNSSDSGVGHKRRTDQSPFPSLWG